MQDELDHYQRRDNNNYQRTVDKDGRRLAVINADEFDDGLIIVPGEYYKQTNFMKLGQCIT